MENIYTQAIADAKAVRESAMANAKAAIQEAFEPKIKAMLKKHIVENEEMYGQKQEGIDDYSDPISAVKELDIPQNVKLSYLKKNYPKVAGIITKLQTAGDMEPYEILELVLGKIGPEETKNVYAYFQSQESNFPGGEEDYMEEEYDEMDEMEMADEASMESPNELDETSLDEILAELDELDEADEIEEAETELEEAYEMDEAEEDEEETEEDGEEEESEEETKVVDITLGDLVDAIKAAMGSEAPAPEMGGEETAAEDDISLDEILAELEDEIEEGEGSGDYMDEAKKKAKDKEEKEKKAEKELKEAKKAIAAMRAELNEINLLNAKLLYVNKIFKSKSLTEAQKVKVLNAFDKAATIKEAKNTYSILNDSITTAPKKSLKESYGFASKPTGATSKTNTVDSDPFISRMQKLAGL
jgi:hypothetical protein